MYIASQKMRSLSLNNFKNYEEKVDQGYDMKKQVLAPEEIRKMLEKRMEERNRVLNLKKNENYQGEKNQYETRNSIINQIYADPKQ
jgi:hypothetical protein